MNSSELTAARIELDLTSEQLAEQLGASGEDVRQWEMGLKNVPRAFGQTIDWLVAMKRRERAIAKSGLAECGWVSTWEAREVPSDPDDAREHFDSFDAHIQHCRECQARERWAEAHLGPPPPMPGRHMLAVLRPLFRLGLALPAWARPALLGAALLLAIVALRVIFAIPMIIAGKFAVPEVALALLSAAGAGALGGFGYSFVGKPLRRIALLGPYLAGIATIGAYCLGLILVAPFAFDESLVKDPSDWYIWGAMAVLFGCVFGHAAFRDKSATRAGA